MEYLLTVKFKFDALDDIMAREMAGQIYSDVTAYTKEYNKEVKLQQIYEDKSPRKVELFGSPTKEEQA